MGQLRYDRLDVQKKQIRLLDLLPGRWIDPISCSIRTVCLAEEPIYDALSYVWGNLQDTVPITVDEETFDATRTLTAALRRLRSSSDTRTLWVDAVCIKQDDKEEKAQQIRIMGQIYQSARTVQVFLGESGVLDLIRTEDQATWDEPSRIHWHRDGTFLHTSQVPPSKIGVSLPT
jgi:hypothetical protein